MQAFIIFKYEKKSKENNIRKRTIVCSRAGIARQKDENINSRDRQSQRCDCPFLIRASLNSQTGVWHILAMKLDHSHEMVNPEHKKFLHNERIIPQDIKDRIEIYHHASCSVPTIRSILKQEYQGLESWIYNDIYNFLKREIDGFEYETRIDESTNELQVIWMYPEQKQYCRFLDVVFDNTYKVNRFNMPFGIFTGVNNFGQSICFAGTLMCQETIDSFTWTFKLFLKMVNNHPPKVILTDEVKAISQAIQNNFGAHWHDFTKAFYECIKEYKVDNFMIKWQQLKEEKWASRYNRDIFLVDMTTFESALEQRNSDLQLVKYCQNHLNVILKTLSPYKYQVAEVLTNYALKLTQEQLLQSTVYSCVELVELRSQNGQFFHIHRI
ncbi:protein FAR1-RELATED SEQUENCE 11 [Rhizophagus irregularis DAOM 181602=DAOM 197198]|nr:protein FAR1-RELATED SEQUENCE 11 [Rhizophagus irregularis DAOM 181602=DAOM 197198]